MAPSLRSAFLVLLLTESCLLARSPEREVSKSELDQSPNNPIQKVWYREMPGCPNTRSVKVPTRILAHLTTKIDNAQRLNFGSEATKIMRDRCSEPKDERGHLVAAMFNAPPKWYNLVPQHHTVNRNVGQSQGKGSKLMDQWLEMENEAREWIGGGRGRWVKWTVEVDYDNGSPRPSQFRVDSDMMQGQKVEKQSAVAVINTGSDAFFIRN